LANKLDLFQIMQHDYLAATEIRKRKPKKKKGRVFGETPCCDRGALI